MIAPLTIDIAETLMRDASLGKVQRQGRSQVLLTLKEEAGPARVVVTAEHNSISWSGWGGVEGGVLETVGDAEGLIEYLTSSEEGLCDL